MTARPESGRERVLLRYKALVIFSVLALVALVVGSVFGDKGLLELLQQEQRTLELEQQVRALRDENARLSHAIRALRSDERAIERLAREELGFARPGETVFLLGDASHARP